jgi:hypothetical protein
MKKFGFAAVVAGGLTAAILGLATPAQVAPSGPGNAKQTISRLEARATTSSSTASARPRWIRPPS